MKTLIAVMLCSGCAVAAPALKHSPKNQSLMQLLLGEPEKPAECPADGLLSITDEISIDSSQAFVRTLTACKGRAVVVEINSPGGSLFAALDMQKAIERHDKPVTCVVDGMAASAAFVTLQSCSKRLMTDRSVLMAHTAAVGVQGHEQALRNGAEALRVIDHAQAKHCAKRLQMSVEDYEAKIANGQEWWLSLDEATEVHAVDGEIASVAEALKSL